LNQVLLEALAQLTGHRDCLAVQTDDLAFKVDDSRATAVVSPDGGNGATQLLARQGYTRTHRFAALPSQSAPRWLLPLGDARRTREGFRIYTPYAPVARTMKNLAVTVIKAGWTGWARNRVLVASKRPLPIELLVREVTGEHEPIFALSLGAPGKFRKLTVQVMRPGAEILGYIKLPLTEAASALIRHEAAALERLWRFTTLRPHLPKVLHAGEWEGGYILFQSSGPSSRGQIEFSPAHEEFLKTLWSVKQIVKPGEALVRETASRWWKAVPRLGDKWRALGDAALERASRELAGVQIPCGIMHGDFTPWNTRAGNGRLFVCDWETSEWEAPNLWDVFHFYTQVESLLNRKVKSSILSRRTSAERASFWLYLLRSACYQVEEAAPDGCGLEYRHQVLTRELS
jgi:hypothetical protein